MSNNARRAVVAALIELAASPDNRDRADAGRALASFAELPKAYGPLSELILDDRDTFVTRVTAEALLRRQDSIGLTIVASALAAIGPDQPNHSDWIHAAVADVFMVFSRDRDAAMQLCQVLARDPDQHLRSGANQMIAAGPRAGGARRPGNELGAVEFADLVPSDDLLRRIADHLDERRVVGTRVLIEPPYYRGLAAVARLSSLRAEPESVRQRSRRSTATTTRSPAAPTATDGRSAVQSRCGRPTPCFNASPGLIGSTTYGSSAPTQSPATWRRSSSSISRRTRLSTHSATKSRWCHDGQR
ncbi:FIG01122338: hypothetical protein [Alloactinosynnema sp. L-07]|nr:FIG01122338: hypothetical protein [Alloactinosynnema sp. L-07]